MLGGVAIYPSTPIVAARIESPLDLSTLVHKLACQASWAPRY